MAIGKLLTGICLLIITSVSYSQSTDFIYKEKGRNHYSATLYFSGDDGAESVATDAFLNYPNAYFTIKPNISSEKEYFKESDLPECFSQVKLIQDGIEIDQATLPKGIANADSEIDKVVLAFPKREIKLYKPIVFVNALDTTEVLGLEDKYYNLYFKYLPIYEEGLELSDNMVYIETFEKMLQIAQDAETNAEIKHYSFYDHATSVLLENAVRQRADSLSRLMQQVEREFQKHTDLKNLNKIDSVYGLMEDGKLIFMPYFKMDFPNSKIYYDEYLSMLEDANSARFLNYEQYKNKILQFLVVEQYDKYQFQLYVDIIARMTTNLDTLRILNGLDLLDITTLDQAQMKPMKEELLMSDFFNDFKTIVQMLNKDILDDGKIFNDSIMANLQRQKAFEHQPYQQIFLAFNELSTNEMLFVNYLRSALTSCTDEELILNIEMWILSYNLSFQNLSTSTVHQINKGIRLIHQQSWDEAESAFGIITRQANTIAPPWFYLGKAQYMLDKEFSAETKFNRAMDIYPEYIAPRLFLFKRLYEQGKLEELLPMIEDALLSNNIWLYHFWRAKTLFALGQNNETIIELEKNCIRINPHNVDEFFLLGDAYKATKKYELAEDAYKKTQEIDIHNAEKKYNQKMRELTAVKNQY